MALKEREDRQGGVCYNQFNCIRLENLWRDRLGKEAACRARSKPSGFQMNMANNCASGGFLLLKHSHNRLESVTEKEIKQSPQTRMSLKGIDADSLEVLAIKHMMKRPSEKFDTPLTTSQELGWLLSNPVRAETLCPAKPRKSRSAAALPERPGPCMDPTIPGCLVHRPREVLNPIPAMSVVSPTNDAVLSRVRSSPTLPTGPSLPEVGQLNSRKWYWPKGSCDVTTYADAYVTMNNGLGPFNRVPVGR